MKLSLNGVEIELPNNAKVDVSKDGKHVKVEMPETEEKIRVVEVPGSSEVQIVERVVERIKIVEVEKPCTRPHYQPYTWPYYYTYTTSGGIDGNYTIGQVNGGFDSGLCGTVTQQASTVTWSNPPFGTQ